MTEKTFNIIGIGEVLWDCLPKGKQLGGAPANFSYISTQLGNQGMILSRIGKDDLGEELRSELANKSFYHVHLQEDEINPTGTVKVYLKDGQPDYEIVENVAWDFIQINEIWAIDVGNCDAICFGSLAQRSEISRKAIQTYIRLAKRLRIFDVNLRQNYFSAEILQSSLELANVCKLNHEELPMVAELLEIKSGSAIETAKKLRQIFNLKLLCVTRGSNGSLLITENEISEFGGLKIKVADTIGAGDAFTAGMTHGLLRNWELNKINEFANRVGAFVASKTGAMPDFSEF